MIFLGHTDCLFTNSGFFELSEPAEVFKSVTGSFSPNSFLLSWRKSCVVISKPYWQGTLVSTAWFLSSLKENFSPDGSILVIWIFRALFEIPRQLICKRRDAQLPCIQRAIRDSRFRLSPSCLCHQAPLDMAGGTLELFGCPGMHSGPRLLCGGTCPEAGHAPNRVQRDDNGGVAEQPLPCTAKGCCYTSVAEVHGSFLCWSSEQWVYLAHQRIQGTVVLIMWGNCF